MDLWILLLICLIPTCWASPDPVDKDYEDIAEQAEGGRRVIPEHRAPSGVPTELIEVNRNKPYDPRGVNLHKEKDPLGRTTSPPANVGVDPPNIFISSPGEWHDATTNRVPPPAPQIAEPPTQDTARGNRDGEGVGFWAMLEAKFEEHLPFIIICFILFFMLLIIICCFANIINMINKKPSVRTIHEEFQKLKDEENADNLDSAGKPISIYGRTKRTVDDLRPTVKFAMPLHRMQGISEEPEEHYTTTSTRITSTSPELVSDDRLRQIEKEIRELESSMKNTSIFTHSDNSYPKELEYLSTRPDQLRDMEILASKPEQLRDLQILVKKTEEIKSVELLTNKPDQLKHVERIISGNTEKQLQEIHTLVQQPHQLEQMCDIVKKPGELTTMANLANRPEELKNLENLMAAKNGKKPEPEAVRETKPFKPAFDRQLSEKSEAIAKLDKILERFSELDSFEVEDEKGAGDNEDIADLARKQARIPSGVAPPRGSVAVQPVPAFKRSSKEQLAHEPSPLRTKPTISLYSTATPQRSQFPPTSRRIGPPEPQLAFGSKVSPSAPAPLKARSGITSSLGRALVHNLRPDFENYSDPDLVSGDIRRERKVQLGSSANAETQSVQDMRT